MWPKALSQLVELAPHITRLLPLADRYFKEKSSGESATQQALDDLQSSHRAALESQRAVLEGQRAAVVDLSDRLLAEVGQLTAQQTTLAATLGRQIAELEKHLAGTRADALAAKQAAESLEGRLTRIETTQRRAQTLAIVALALLAASLMLIVMLFFHAH